MSEWMKEGTRTKGERDTTHIGTHTCDTRVCKYTPVCVTCAPGTVVESGRATGMDAHCF